ncbi:MAG: phage portal protein [Alistipes sp.]|nr:phage portal protein [Alistipes sp.]
MDKTERKSIICIPRNEADTFYATSGRRVESDDYWRWGVDNRFPEALALLSRRSTVHRRIVNDKADYISGKGFTYDSEIPLLGEIVACANGDGESLRQVVNKVAFDKILFGNAFVEVVTDEAHSFLSFYHQDASRCRVAKCGGHILIHHDWSQFKRGEAVSLPLYPNFEKQGDGMLHSIIHYKDYEPMFEHYGVPQYIAGMNVSAIAYKTDRWNIARLDSSFQPSGIMMLENTIDSEEEAARLMRTAESRFAGRPGQVMFIIKGGSEEESSRFIPIESKSDGDWKALHEQSTNDIVVAHSWFRSLSGLDYTTGFNAERILHEYEVALNTVILGEQAELMEPILNAISTLLAVDSSSLVIVNRPPTNSKPVYMKVWEARKADGLDYDESDERQQLFLSEIVGSNVTRV